MLPYCSVCLFRTVSAGVTARRLSIGGQAWKKRLSYPVCGALFTAIAQALSYRPAGGRQARETERSDCDPRDVIKLNMDEDVKEMVWESENNSKFQAHFKDTAKESFCTFNYQTTPMLHRDFDKSVKTLRKPFFITALTSEVPKLEKNMAVADHTKVAQSAKVKQNGTSHSNIIPAHFTFMQKPARNTEVESRKLRTLNAAVGKTNHTIGFAFEKSFPIKNAASLSSWSGAFRRSPKKVQRRPITTVEECLRAEEKELYRQLIQVVTGKTVLSTNSTSFLPPEISRRLSSSSASGQPGASSLSSLEPCTLDVEPTYQPKISLVPEKRTTAPLSVDTTFKLTCESRDVTKHQLHRAPRQSAQEPVKGSDSIIVLDPVPKEDYNLSRTVFPTDLWIKEIASRYDPRARERNRQIEEQKALTLKFQNQRLQERSVHDAVELKLRVPLEKEIPVTLLPRPECIKEEQEFPAITPEMEKEIKHALYGGNQDQVLSEAFRLTITRKDIMTLNSLNWLNDEVINFYMNLLMERSKRKGLPKVHAFNTFFFPKLKCAGFQAVKRWTKKVDVFSADVLLVPVHLGVHWCLAVVDFRKKTVTYYDSMGGLNNEACRILLQYLKQESQDKKGISFDTNGWHLSSRACNEIPQQMNGSDCGMFACKYADYITKEKPITFTQNHMPYFRKRMVYEIIHQKLL
ncbi:sentrin-specific protease 1 isoform 2-T2 [Anomaloglossus baeobatrachus]|uniref:sentrin-specific protease 1 isoform X2 n=1 Tax=Anomaloglossus baeobatrachus TaxID=238106 RepID=UPI003F5052F7